MDHPEPPERVPEASAPEPSVSDVPCSEEVYVKSLQDLQDRWPDWVEHCSVVQPTLQHILRDSWPVALTKTSLKIGFDPEFAEDIDHARRIDPGGMRHLFQKILGHPVHLEFTLLDRPVRWSHRVVNPSKTQKAPEAETTEAFDAASAGLNPQAWLRNQTVRDVLEVFHGDIVEIQP